MLERKSRLQLQRLIADGNTPQKIVKRARIVLMTADGHGVMAIMREVGVAKTTVWRWQEYFAEAGVEGLVEGRSKPPGRKPISAAIKLKVVEKTVKERPVNATHWSVRSMAKEMGISHTSVQRIWAEHDLKPHLVKSFKVSTDPTQLRSRTSSDSTSTRRRGRLCWPSTRKARFKHSTGPSQACL
jgi:transposase